MVTDETCLRLADDVTHQSMGPGEDSVMLSLNSGYLYTCNETALAFFSALDGKRSFREVIDLLAQEFDVPREKLKDDMANLADKVIAEGLVVVAGEKLTGDA